LPLFSENGVNNGGGLVDVFFSKVGKIFFSGRGENNEGAYGTFCYSVYGGLVA
jgi:hypothetical protein